MSDGAVAFYQGDVVVVWNKSATYNVYLYGREVDVFTNYEAKTLDEANKVVDNWLKENEYI